MSEQQSNAGGASGIGEQFEQARQRVMNNETVQRVVNNETVQRVMNSDTVRTWQQQIQSQGPDLVEKVKSLAAEAMVRRIAIQQEGRTLFEFPLALGLGGALLAPQLAALGALAALIGNCTITVEREEPGSGQPSQTGQANQGSTSSTDTSSTPTASGSSGTTST